MVPSRLVLHADDFGMNRAVTDGILHGFSCGLLTSTSLLANAPDSARALTQWNELLSEQAAGKLPSAAARQRLDDPNCPFDLGIHLNLTQGRPLGGDRYPAELLDAEGRFPGVFALFARLFRSGRKYREAIRDEWRRQIQFLCDHRLQPTHLNGHQYVEMLPVAVGIVPELMEQFGIKTVRVAWEPALFRNTVLYKFGIAKWPLAAVKYRFAARFRKVADTHAIAHPDAFFGTAHAGCVTLRLLQRFLSAARSCRSVEVALHPGHSAADASTDDDSDGWRDPLTHRRSGELEMLASEELGRWLEASAWRLGRLQVLRGASARFVILSEAEILLVPLSS